MCCPSAGFDSSASIGEKTDTIVPSCDGSSRKRTVNKPGPALAPCEREQRDQPMRQHASPEAQRAERQMGIHWSTGRWLRARSPQSVTFGPRSPRRSTPPKPFFQCLAAQYLPLPRNFRTATLGSSVGGGSAALVSRLYLSIFHRASLAKALSSAFR